MVDLARRCYSVFGRIAAEPIADSRSRAIIEHGEYKVLDDLGSHLRGDPVKVQVVGAFGDSPSR